MTKRKKRKKKNPKQTTVHVRVNPQAREKIRKLSVGKNQSIPTFMDDMLKRIETNFKNEKEWEVEKKNLKRGFDEKEEKYKERIKKLIDEKKKLLNDLKGLRESFEKCNKDKSLLLEKIDEINSRCKILESLNEELKLDVKSYFTKKTFEDDEGNCKHLLGLKWNNVETLYAEFESEFHNRLIHLSGKKISETRTKRGDKNNVNEDQRITPEKVNKNFIPDSKMFHYFLMTLCYLRRGLTTLTLAILFGVPKSTVSAIRRNMIKIISFKSKEKIKMTKDNYLRNITQQVREIFGPCIVVLTDCTYLYIQHSLNPEFQKLTYCKYKHKNLIKLLTLNSSSGNFVFYLTTNLGGKQDNDMFFQSNVMKMLIDFYKEYKIPITVLSDKGFMEGTEFWGKIPKFITVLTPKTVKDGNRNYGCCSTRITVENYYAHLKHWRSLKNIDNKTVDILDDIVNVCVYINNLFLTKLRK